MIKTIILVLITEFLMTIGQICFKKSANRLNEQGVPGKAWIINLLESILCYPTLWMGGIAMLAGLLFWFAALNSGELNYVYLLGSIQYIFTILAGYFFLHEKIDAPKLTGTLLITAGIILTVISK